MNRHYRLSAVSAAVLSLALSACGAGSVSDDHAEDSQPQQMPGPDGQSAPQVAQQRAKPAVQSQPSRSGSLDSSQKLEKMQIFDRHLQMPVGEVQLPVGWQSMGGVAWNEQTGCGGNQIQITWSALAPDGLTSISALPSFSWQVGSAAQFNPCPVAPFRSVREFLEAHARQLHPNARVVNYTDRSAKAQEEARKVEQKMRADNTLPPGYDQMKQQIQQRAEGGELLIAYTENGVAMQAVLIAGGTFSSTPGNPPMGGIGGILVFRAPENKLFSESLRERIQSSIEIDPQWGQASLKRVAANIQRYIDNSMIAAIRDQAMRQMAADNARTAQQIAQINVRGAQDTMREMQKRQDIRMGTISAVGASNTAIYNNTMQTNAQIQSRTVDTIRGIDPYAGVDGRRVENPIGNGQRVFQNTNDPNAVFSTDDPYYSPPNGDYQELRRLPY
jgi:hypothetical protein